MVTSLPLLALAAVMDCVPHEYLIDFGPELPFKYNMTVEFWARDGTSLGVPTIIPEDWNPEGTKGLILSVLKDNRWVARSGPGAMLIVTGTKKGSPIKYVTVKSELVLPIQMRWVLLPPNKK